MWNSNLTLLALAAFLRTDYELHQAIEDVEQPQFSTAGEENALNKRQREWAEKAVRHYREAQQKKWRHWQEAMFEAKIPSPY